MYYSVKTRWHRQNGLSYVPKKIVTWMLREARGGLKATVRNRVQTDYHFIHIVCCSFLFLSAWVLFSLTGYAQKHASTYWTLWSQAKPRLEEHTHFYRIREEGGSGRPLPHRSFENRWRNIDKLYIILKGNVWRFRFNLNCSKIFWFRDFYEQFSRNDSEMAPEWVSEKNSNF